MGTRSHLYNNVDQKLRANHDPATRRERAMAKIQRKFNRPIWRLRGAQAMFRDTLAAVAPGKDREWCENQRDLPERLRNELNRLAATESSYANWRADTQLLRGFYEEHQPSRELKTRINKAAIASTKDPRSPSGAEEAQEKVSRFVDKLCRRQFTRGSNARRRSL